MKYQSTIAALILVVAVGTGCTTRYDVVLSNGTVVTSVGRPKLTKSQEAYIFTDVNGRTNTVAVFRVTQIRSQSARPDKVFNVTQ